MNEKNIQYWRKLLDIDLVIESKFINSFKEILFSKYNFIQKDHPKNLLIGKYITLFHPEFLHIDLVVNAEIIDGDVVCKRYKIFSTKLEQIGQEYYHLDDVGFTGFPLDYYLAGVQKLAPYRINYKLDKENLQKYNLYKQFRNPYYEKLYIFNTRMPEFISKSYGYIRIIGRDIVLKIFREV